MNKTFILIATAGSAALLLGAFGFQYLGDLPPCKMCIWQRWPHGIAILAGVLALAMKQRMFAWLGAVATLITSLIGFYHAGVEKGIFEGPDSCTSGPVGGMSTDDLFNQIMNAPLVRCDEIPWDMFGISMAGWNALVSLGLFCIWIMASRRS
ncbi:disulfide bond formation protein B [Halocynthiibacter namhaensis]|uniref:disulfide bond formation protein B n=1 Tax=Halocynthiibacter namhaensis TaxID=1290553 RepID=UPI0005792C10|nr:disulfide bond formation protein B [Halocynthiibacter namhaensis]